MFQIDNRSHKSIYEQVVDNVKELIMTDVLKENEKLPSVRELSKQLTINPNTVQKAFRQLDAEGYIYSVSGKGTFVSPKKEIKKNPEKIEEIMKQVVDLYKQLLYLGLDEAGARSLIMNTLLKEGASHD